MDRLAFYFRTAGSVCLLVAATISAWRFGGSKSSDQVWIMGCLLAGSILFFMAELGTSGNRTTIPKIFCVILLAFAFGVVQLLPLPCSIHQAVDPQGLQWWTTLSMDDSPAAESQKFPISLYPGSTRHDLAVFGFGAVSLTLASLLYFRTKYILWFLVIVLLNGALTAFFGIAQMLSFNGKLYWIVPLTQGGTPFAAFVNQNHAAGYLNLCLAAGLGLYVYLDARSDPGTTDETAEFGWDDSADQRKWQSFAVLIACVLIAAAIVCTASRGGTVSAFAALVAIIGFSRKLRNNKSFRQLGYIVALAGLALATWLGRAVFLHQRFQHILSEDGVPDNGRLSHWADALRAASDFLLTGTGIGTYRFAYRPYETSFVSGWYYHAENQYVEALLEGGLPGLILLLIMLFAAFQMVQRRLRASGNISFAFGIAGLFAITSQAVHACFDFGLYMPSNAILFGLLVGCLGIPKNTVATNASSKLPWFIVLLLLVSWTGWGTLELSKQARLERRQRDFAAAVAELPDSVTVWPASLDDTSGLPDSAEAHLQNATIEFMNYQLATFDELTVSSSSTDSKMLWRLSAPRILHQRAHKMIANGNVDQVLTLRSSSQIQNHLKKAYNELKLARQGCPLLPRAHIGLAKLGVLFDEDQYEIGRLSAVAKLSPFVPDVLFQVGLLDLQANRADPGFERWNRCLLLSPRYIDQIMQIASSVIGTPELIDRVLPRSPKRLVQIADRYFAADESASNRLRLAEIAEQALLDDATPKGAETLALMGHICRLKGDWDRAIENLASAVALVPSDVESRFALATLLLQADRLREAQHHATICQRLDPAPRKHASLLRKVRERLTKEMSRP